MGGDTAQNVTYTNPNSIRSGDLKLRVRFSLHFVGQFRLSSCLKKIQPHCTFPGFQPAGAEANLSVMMPPAGGFLMDKTFIKTASNSLHCQRDMNVDRRV